MINPNTKEDTEELRRIYRRMKRLANKLGVDLKWVEVKGTIYFFPQLEAK